jgi:uncharacterized protein (DUF3084 family)
MIVMRFLFALLVGFIAGVGATFYVLHSGAGDLLIRRAEVVQDLQHRLRDVEQQRDQLARQLDDVVGRSSRMETAFGELERRFRELERERPEAEPGS